MWNSVLDRILLHRPRTLAPAAQQSSSGQTGLGITISVQDFWIIPQLLFAQIFRRANSTFTGLPVHQAGGPQVRSELSNKMAQRATLSYSFFLSATLGTGLEIGVAPIPSLYQIPCREACNSDPSLWWSQASILSQRQVEPFQSSNSPCHSASQLPTPQHLMHIAQTSLWVSRKGPECWSTPAHSPHPHQTLLPTALQINSHTRHLRAP